MILRTGNITPIRLTDWQPWFKEWGHYKIARVANPKYPFLGYTFARRYGFILRFWTLKGAQDCADQLNKEAQ